MNWLSGRTWEINSEGKRIIPIYVENSNFEAEDFSLVSKWKSGLFSVWLTVAKLQRRGKEEII